MSGSRRRSAARARRSAAASRAVDPAESPTHEAAGGTDSGGGAAEGPAAGVPERAVPEDAPPGPAPWVPWLAFVLCLLGLADSIYLVYVHYNPGALVCQTSGTFNCTAVQTSPESMVFGVIPVAWLGLGYFVVMTALNLPRVWRVPDMRLVWLRMAAVVAGMGMVIYLVVAELFEIKAICEYCTGVHAVTFVLFVATMLTYPSLSYRARWVAWARGGR